MTVRPAPDLPRRPEGPQSAPRPRENRLRALDGLRLVAALMVAAYHYGGRGGEITQSWGASAQRQLPTLHTYFSYGCVGVQVIFVVGGFVICMDRVLGVCWTLWAEVRFYVLFALCVVLPGASRRRVIMFCAGWTLAAAITQTAHQPLLDVVFMPEYASFFIGGVGLYLVHRDRRDVYAWGIVVVSFLIGQHYAVRSLWNVSDPNAFAHRSSLGIVLVVAFGFLAVAAIALGWLRWANWRWLTVAGALTYPFYLVHEHLGWVVIKVLHRDLGLPSAVTFALTIASMLALAWLLNRFVEDRLTPRLRTALNKTR